MQGKIKYLKTKVYNNKTGDKRNFNALKDLLRM
jgi:hypothetical protein